MDFDVLDEIKKVEVSPFFKEKALRKIDAAILQKNNKEYDIFNWFTPKLQLASIALILLINTTAIFYAFEDKENDSLDNFAEDFNLYSQDNFQIKSFK